MPLQIWSYEPAELARKRAADRFSRKAEQTLDPTPTPPWTPPPTLEDETRPPVGPQAAASFRDRADQQLQAWQVAMARGGTQDATSGAERPNRPPGGRMTADDTSAAFIAPPGPSGPSLGYQRPGLTAEQGAPDVQASGTVGAQTRPTTEPAPFAAGEFPVTPRGPDDRTYLGVIDVRTPRYVRGDDVPAWVQQESPAAQAEWQQAPAWQRALSLGSRAATEQMRGTTELGQELGRELRGEPGRYAPQQRQELAKQMGAEVFGWAEPIKLGGAGRLARAGAQAATATTAAEPVIAPPFYSKLEQVVDAKMANRAQPGEVRKLLESQGVKADEIKSTGLDEWLAERSATGQKVTKAEVQEYLLGNKVEIKEVVKGKPDAAAIEAADEAAAAAMREWENYRRSPQAQPDEVDRLQEVWKSKEQATQDMRSQTPGKYAQYSLPGGSNYRELLLTLPTKTPQPSAEWRAYEQWAKERGIHPTSSDARQRYKDVTGKEAPTGPSASEIVADMTTNYRSSHWDEPNVLAAVRFDERIDADGKRVLMVNELQSDWHQAGKREGYQQLDKRITSLPEGYEIRQKATPGEENYPRYAVFDPQGRQMSSWDYNKESAVNSTINTLNGPVEQGVPPAPFAKTWPELSMKRVIRWATENGFDRVAWPGAAEQVRLVEKWPELRNVDGRWLTSGDKDVTPIVNRYLVDLPRFVNQQGKKWGARVKTTEIPASYGEVVRVEQNPQGRRGWYWVDRNGNPTQGPFATREIAQQSADEAATKATVHAIDLTPQWKRAVLYEGQPLFVAGGPALALPPQQDGESDEAYRARLATAGLLTALGVKGMRGAGKGKAAAGAGEPMAKGTSAADIAVTAAREQNAVKLAQLKDQEQQLFREKFSYPKGTPERSKAEARYNRVVKQIERIDNDIYKAGLAASDAAATAPTAPPAANTATDVRQAFGELGGGMGRSIREADLKAAEERMAKLKEKYPQATDEWIAEQPLAKQIQRYKDELAGTQTAAATAAPVAPAPVPAKAVPVTASEAANAPTQPAAATTPPEPPKTAVGAATLPEPTGPLPERAGNILLEKFPAELRPSLVAQWQKDPDRFEAARRGVIADAEVAQMADELGLTPAQFTSRWKQGKAYNAETLLASRMALEEQTREVMLLQKAIKGGANDDTTLGRFQIALTKHAALQEAVSGATAEAGRALRQFRQVIPATADAAAMQKVLERYGGRESVEKLAARLAQLDTDNPIAVANFVRNAVKPRAMDYLLELWYNSILSSPRTQIVNVLSNAVNATIAPAERAVAAGLEMGLARAQRRPAGRFFGEAPAEALGLVRGLQEGARKGVYILRNGHTLEESQKIELRRPEAFQGKLGAIINTPSRALSAADALFRSMGYSGALHAEAYREASMQGLKGDARVARMAELLASPSPAMQERSRTMAAYRVFQQKPGTFTGPLMQFRKGEIGGVPVVRFVLPFLQTPVNVLKYGLERSPLGGLNPELYKALARGDAAASDMLGRWLGGSLMAAAIATYAWEGKITGRAPEKEGERDAFYRQGKQPFSIKVGEQWVSYQRLEPFNQPFAQIAALAAAAKRGEEPPLAVATDMAVTIGRNLVSQTYLTGLNDVLDALEDPKRYGGRFAERTAAGFVPFSSLGRTLAQATDDTMREPKGLIEQVKANVPGLSEQVPARLDVMGQEVKRETPWFSPINVTAAKDDPLETELARLKVTPGKVGDSLGGKKLTREQQFRYQQEAGQTSQAGLQALLDSAYYKGLDDVGKEKALKSITNRMRDMAAENTRQSHTTTTAELVQQGTAYATAWAEYNALPKYRNLDVATTAQADAALTKIRALAKDRNISQDRALAMYRQTDAAGAQAAQRALNLGANPARRDYLRKHPELTRLLEPVD